MMEFLGGYNANYTVLDSGYILGRYACIALTCSAQPKRKVDHDIIDESTLLSASSALSKKPHS